MMIQKDKVAKSRFLIHTYLSSHPSTKYILGKNLRETLLFVIVISFHSWKKKFLIMPYTGHQRIFSPPLLVHSIGQRKRERCAPASSTMHNSKEKIKKSEQSLRTWIFVKEYRQWKNPAGDNLLKPFLKNCFHCCSLNETNSIQQLYNVTFIGDIIDVCIMCNNVMLVLGGFCEKFEVCMQFLLNITKYILFDEHIVTVFGYHPFECKKNCLCSGSGLYWNTKIVQNGPRHCQTKTVAIQTIH